MTQVHQDTLEAGAALRLRYRLQGVEQLGQVGGIRGPRSRIAGGMDPGGPVQGVHFDPRVVRDGRESAVLGGVAGLEDGVLHEALPRLLRLRDPEVPLGDHPDPAAFQQLVDFAHLAGVVAGQHDGLAPVGWLHDALPSTTRAKAKRLTLGHLDLGDPGGPEGQERVEIGAAEGGPLGGPLDLDEAPLAVHDQVHVRVGLAVLRVVQVQDRHPRVDPHRDRRDLGLDGVLGQPPAGLEARDGVVQGHPGPGDGGGAGAPVRLEHVAVQGQGALAERIQIHRRPQGAANQPLDLQGTAALLAPRRLPGRALPGGTGQHAVLGRDPTLALALEEGWHLVLHAGGA